MRVKHVSIKNIAGIQELEIQPGTVTIIEGRNASGKSSVHDALLSVFTGGHDATLLRQGEEAGEAVVVLEDDVQIRNRITEKGSSRTVKHPEMGTIGKPAGYVERLIDALSVNPIEFLHIRPEHQGQYLLEAVPRSLSIEEIRDAIGDALDEELPAGAAAGHALQAIERVRKVVFTKRTEENRLVRDKASTIAQLETTVPAEPVNEKALTAQHERVRVELADLTRQRAVIDAEVDKTIAEAERAVDDQLTAKLDKLRRDYETAVAQERAAAEKAKRMNGEMFRERARAKTADLEPKISELSAREGELRQQLAQVGAIAHQQQTLAGLRADHAAATEKSEALTAALERLDQLKTRLMQDLPFEGISVGEDGQIYDAAGLPFRRWNTAERVKFAIKLAQLRSGDLGLILADGLECLDPEAFEEFERWASDQDDLTLIVTRVTGSDLTVRTLEAEAA